MKIFVNAAFGFSLVSSIMAVLLHIFKKPRLEFFLKSALILAFCTLTAGMGLFWTATGRPPLATQYESLLCFTWCAYILTAFFYFSTKTPGMLTALATAAPLLLAGASLISRDPVSLIPALRSNWLLYHVVACMAAYAAFALAAILAAFTLLGHKEGLEPLMARLIKAGFVLLTAGIITGSVWADAAWGSYWSWDPKETWSFITWLFYAVILHLRKSASWRGDMFAWAVLVGFTAVLFTYFGVNFLLTGLHSYA